jgi:hypothetical protein
MKLMKLQTEQIDKNREKTKQKKIKPKQRVKFGEWGSNICLA